jgi:hypothetical protein
MNNHKILQIMTTAERHQWLDLRAEVRQTESRARMASIKLEDFENAISDKAGASAHEPADPRTDGIPYDIAKPIPPPAADMQKEGSE